MAYQPGNNLSLGQIAGRNEHFMLPRDARDKHLYICGGTGTGKSRLLEWLIRQDIVAWQKSRCGLLLLDPHGSLYDNLLAWLARHNLNRPVIPIDLRQDNWVVSYNLLRQRKVANSSVIIDNVVEAMAYVWGQQGTNQTPLFARWASNILQTLYEKQHTLVEAIALLDSPVVRRTMTADLKDRLSQRDWRFAQNLSIKDFENQVSSTVNRLQRFLRNELMRTMLGQPEASLDLGTAIEEGAIILVSLAREKAQVSTENVELFATLLLTDLWTAAQERGKHGGLRPFYVYLDEFQRFITPTIAENLDEARGFGLHLTLAHQFPLQLIDRGANGERVYHSIMENATTKVVFRMTHEDNLKPLAQWLYMGVMNPDRIKYSLYSTKVMEYRREYEESESHSTAISSGGSRHMGSSRGAGQSLSEGFDVEEELVGSTKASTKYGTRSTSEGESWSASESRSITRRPVLVPILGQELSHIQFETLEEQLARSMALLFDQRQRHCVARIGDRMCAPVALHVPDVLDAIIRPERIERYIERLCRKWPFMLPMQEATKRLLKREQEIADGAIEGVLKDEPTTTRRKIK